MTLLPALTPSWHTLSLVTKPRTSVRRELYGFIGTSSEAKHILREWNARFRERGIDASMDFYPTTEKNLPERLSEMFHFDRRGYVVGKELQKRIVPLLDRLDGKAQRQKKVDWVLNRKGVMTGFWLGKS